MSLSLTSLVFGRRHSRESIMELIKYHPLPNGECWLELPSGKYVKVEPSTSVDPEMADIIKAFQAKTMELPKPEQVKESVIEVLVPVPEEKEEFAPPSPKPEEKEEFAPPVPEPVIPKASGGSGGAGGAWSVIARKPKPALEYKTETLTNQEIHDRIVSQATTPYMCGGKAWDFRDIVWFLLMKALVFPINPSLFDGDKHSDTYMKYGRVASTAFRKKVYDTFHIETEKARTVGNLINMFSDFKELDVAKLRTSIAQAVSVIASAWCNKKWHKPHCTFKHKDNETELFQWISTVLNNIVRTDTDVHNVFEKVFGEHMCSDRNKMSHIFNVIIVTVTEIVGTPRTHPKIELDFSGTTPHTLGMADRKMDDTFQRLCYVHAIDDATPSNDGYDEE